MGAEAFGTRLAIAAAILFVIALIVASCEGSVPSGAVGVTRPTSGTGGSGSGGSGGGTGGTGGGTGGTGGGSGGSTATIPTVADVTTSAPTTSVLPPYVESNTDSQTGFDLELVDAKANQDSTRVRVDVEISNPVIPVGGATQHYVLTLTDTGGADTFSIEAFTNQPSANLLAGSGVSGTTVSFVFAKTNFTFVTGISTLDMVVTSDWSGGPPPPDDRMPDVGSTVTFSINQ